MKNNSKFSPLDLAYIAIFAALLAICSWIAVPTTIPFTMQTFGVFLTMGVLGGRRGTISILVYVVLATVGVPVLAEFTGGPGIVFGSTGGYILGFLLAAVVMWIFERVFGTGLPVLAAGMILGMILCYAFGTAWFMVVYAQTGEAIGIATALLWCVVPFIIPDLIKIGLALFVTATVRRHVKI